MDDEAKRRLKQQMVHNQLRIEEEQRKRENARIQAELAARTAAAQRDKNKKS